MQAIDRYFQQIQFYARVHAKRFACSLNYQLVLKWFHVWAFLFLEEDYRSEMQVVGSLPQVLITQCFIRKALIIPRVLSYLPNLQVLPNVCLSILPFHFPFTLVHVWLELRFPIIASSRLWFSWAYHVYFHHAISIFLLRFLLFLNTSSASK